MLHNKLCIIPKYEIYPSRNAGKYCTGGGIFWDKIQNHPVMYKLPNVFLKSYLNFNLYDPLYFLTVPCFNTVHAVSTVIGDKCTDLLLIHYKWCAPRSSALCVILILPPLFSKDLEDTFSRAALSPVS